MEQVKELLNILKDTPEMALWGIGMYFAFTLLKAASWISALALVLKQLIKRFFDWKEKELDYSDVNFILSMFKDNGIDKSEMSLLLEAIKHKSGGYIYTSDIKKAIKAIKEHKD